MSTYVIADIAGQYDALMRLVARFDKDSKIILLGDLIDRGPKSREVIEWAISGSRLADSSNQWNVETLLGNHEHMFIDWYDVKMCGIFPFYQLGIYEMNGGGATINSYMTEPTNYTIPNDHIEWLKTRPKYIEITINGKDFFLSHAPLAHYLSIDDADKTSSDAYYFKHSLLWNREKPQKRDNMVQLFGHNSHWGVTEFKDKDGIWAMCLDDSGKQVLTAMKLDDFSIIQENY